MAAAAGVVDGEAELYRDIGDYGAIGDMHGVALVSRDGSIDYCSLPYMDSPTVFAALLDDDVGGRFSICPDGEFRSVQEYLKDTNILSCTFETAEGRVALYDFMPITASDLAGKDEHLVHRCLKGLSGEVRLTARCFPAPGYGLEKFRLERDGDMVRVRCSDETFTLVVRARGCSIEIEPGRGVTVGFSLREGEDAHFEFLFGDGPPAGDGDCALEECREFWIGWLHTCVGDRCVFWGEYMDMVNRSLLALKLLTFQPTGAIAAAATTSLPESLGGERNWDYRATWLRDSAFTLKAMFALGHITEADSFVRWLHDTYRRHGSRDLQIMYSLTGERELEERTLEHLEGYRGSRPVRVGNAAFRQQQWDIYGEVMDSALRLSDYAGRIDETLWPFFRDVCSSAARDWKKPDHGLWEVRNGPFHFVYSKVMCWVALDRGIKIARRYGFPAPLDEWEKVCEAIREEVLARGYDRGLGSFVQRYGSSELDASLLLLGLMDFLPLEDSRMQGTIRACTKELMRDGFLLRYAADDGLEGEEGAFLLCNFWLVECLARLGRLDEARELLATTCRAANHLGLFAEEYDQDKSVLLGNFPQAFSHIGYINAVAAIMDMQGRLAREGSRGPLVSRMRKLIPRRAVLNSTERAVEGTGSDVAPRLKVALNHLQGAFFDTSTGRVDYRAMRASGSFREYLALAEELNGFDPSSLQTGGERKAFWLNIYNILIIHGIIHFDITHSVKDVVDFFGRIGYMVGGLFFSPDDVEHGILRGNRPQPGSRRKPFAGRDRRRALCVEVLDPRIHFALVCGASSCPPIEFYDAVKIEAQLDIAGRSFVNREGLSLDREGGIVHLSSIFRWYARDFAKTRKGVLDFALQFADDATREYVAENRKGLAVRYSSYDWDLNKTLG